MSVRQNFGVLRIVRAYHGHVLANPKKKRQQKYSAGWLPEERLVHLLTRRETLIGRALSCDLVLLDPAVSREHARLVLDGQGWRIFNMTTGNIVRVNGRSVPGGSYLQIRPQDFVLLGNTMLQLVAPQLDGVQGVAEGVLPPPVTTPLTALADLDVPILNGHEKNGEAATNEELVEIKSSLEQVEQIPELVSNPGQASEERIGVPAQVGMVDEEWGEEKGWRTGVTMQFALRHHNGVSLRWIIGGVSLVFFAMGAVVALILRNVISSISALTQYGPLSMAAALTIPIIPAIGISLIVNFIDRFEREPWFLRLVAFAWGAVIAAPIALLIERYLEWFTSSVIGPNAGAAWLSISQGLGTGITEELLKGVGLILLFFALRDEFDNVTDGIVYGALIGAGFAMVENFFYFIDNPQILPFLFVGRIVLGWLTHSTFTACFGVALGYIRHTKVRWQHFSIPLLGLLVAIGLHTVFDFVNTFANDLVTASPHNQTVITFSLVAIVGNYIPPFIVQIVVLYCLIKSLAHEVALIREFLASEVSNGVVTIAEYTLLQHSFGRTREERRVLWSCGWKQWLLVKELYQTEIGLAFRKWHVSMGDKPKLGYVQPEDAYRRRIRHLRQKILVLEAVQKQT